MNTRRQAWVSLAIAALAVVTARAQFGAPGDGPTTSAPVEPAPNPWNNLPKFEQLSNGLRICVLEDHSLPLVSVQVCFRVGSAADPPSQPGLCHVVATLLAQRDDLHLKLRALGVAATATTHRDMVCFTSTLHPALVERVIEIEAARMKACCPAGRSPADARATTAAELEAARNAAALTRWDEFGHHDGPFERRALAALFGAHPYNDPPNFVAETLARATPVEIDEFISRWFPPGNATLFILGDVSEVRVLDHARRMLGELPYRESLRRPEPIALKAETLTIAGVPAGSVGVDWGFLTPPLGAFDNAAIDVLMQRLCNPVDGILTRAALAAGIPPPLFRRDSWEHCGTVWLTIDAASEAPNALLMPLLRDALATAAETPADPIEHNRARALAAAAAAERRAGFSDRMLRLAEFELVAGDILLAEYELPQIQRVTVSDVRAAAEFLLSTRSVCLERVADSAFGGWDSRAIIAREEAAAGLSATLIPPPQTWPDPGLRLARLAEVGDGAETPARPAPVTPKIVTRTFPNGVQAIVCRVRGMSRACVRTILDGIAADSNCVDVLMCIGTARRSPEQTLDYLTYHGIELHTRSKWRRPYLNALGPAALVAQMLEIQAELLQSPQDSNTTCAAILADQAKRSSRTVVWQELRFLRSPQLVRRAFGAVNRVLDADDVTRAISDLAHLPPPRIIVVGDVDPSLVIAEIGARWRDWKPAPSLTTHPAASAADRPALTELFAPNTEMRAALMISMRTTALLRRDSVADRALDFVQTLLDAAPLGTPQSWRLDEWLAGRWAANCPTIVCRMSDDQVEAAVAGMHDRIEQLRSGRVDSAQAVLAARLTDARRWLRLDSANAIADALEQSDGDPWSNAGGCDADVLLAAIRENEWIGSVRFSASSPDAAVRERLRRLPWHIDVGRRADDEDR